MPNELRLTGFSELQRDLALLPAELQARAAGVLQAHAERALEAVRAAYPVVTGTLRDGVKLIARVPRGVAALFTVTSSAVYAHIYEFGGVHQRPRATFLPITGRERRASTADVVAIVTAAGITVRGQHSD